jgi:hypothetical protein
MKILSLIVCVVVVGFLLIGLLCICMPIDTDGE